MSVEEAALLVFGILALFILFIGRRKGFFEFKIMPWDFPIRLTHVLGAFGIYFIATYLFSSLASLWFKKHLSVNFTAFSSWINFGLSFLVFLFLTIYFKMIPQEVRLGILRRKNQIYSPKEDIWAAIYSWIMAFPLVLFLSQGLEAIVVRISGLSGVPDQIAVKFLKSTFEDPLYFVLAVLSIIILAPLVEESLFRGFLQSFIRQHLGPKQAILITSISFSLFHYSSAQGLGNISIIPSLFVLSLFLGFLYEKRGSLLAPMILHALFNSVSVLNLYLFGEFTGK